MTSVTSKGANEHV